MARGSTISIWKSESSSISMKNDDEDDDEDVVWSGDEKRPSNSPIRYTMKELAERNEKINEMTYFSFSFCLSIC